MASMLSRRDKDAAVQQPREEARQTACLNCGEAVMGRYCHNCGQTSGAHNRSLWLFVQEFFEEFFRLDSKFLRSIVPLLTKPGFLTQEWVAGRRAKYITPLKLYVTLSAVCFLAISLVPNSSVIHVNTGKDDKAMSAARTALNNKEKAESTSAFDRLVDRQVSKLTLSGPIGDANRIEFQRQMIDRLPTVNLILLPIFALLFKLLYIRRSRFYVEHLVFALHSYAFFSLGMAIVVLCTDFAWIVLPVMLWMFLYLPIAMARNYQQGVIKTLVKWVMFCGLYALFVSAALLGTVVYTASRLRDDAPQPAVSAPVARTKHPDGGP